LYMRISFSFMEMTIFPETAGAYLAIGENRAH